MPRQVRNDALIIFCLLAFIYAYFYQDASYNGNSRFGLIFAIVQEGRLTIDTYQNREGTITGDKAYYNGHYYSDKAIGPSLVGAAFYVPLLWVKLITGRLSQSAAKVILTFLVVGLPSAIAGSLIYIFCYYLSKSRSMAFLVTLAIALGTLYFPYSTIFFSHQFSAALLFAAFFMIFFLKEKERLWKSWYLFLIGWLLGWALIGEYPTVIILLALIAYYFSIVWRNPTYRHLRSLLLPALGGFIPVLLQLIYNQLSFGNFFSTGYANLNDQGFRLAMQQGIMGIGWPDLSALYYMILHPTMGLFWQSPVLLFFIVGVGAIFFIQRRYRAEAILALVVIVSYLLIMSGYFMWWGGWALGPRHIIPVLPFFCVLLIFIPRRLTLPFLVLALISIGQMLIATASDVNVPDEMILKVRDLGFFEYSNIYNFSLQQLIQGRFAQNLGQQLLGLSSWSSLIPLLAVIFGVTLFFFMDGRQKSPRRWLKPV